MALLSPWRIGVGAALLAALGLAVPASAGLGRLTQTLRRETSSLATLESISDWIVRSEQELEEARFRQQRLGAEIALRERRRAAIRERLASRRQQLQLRLRALYKMSRGGLIRLLLEAPDEHQLSGRLAAASLILRRDVREIGTFGDELARLAEERRRLQAARTEAAALRQRLEAKQRELRSGRDQQLAALRRVQHSRLLQQALAGELDAHQRALLHRIGELGRRVRTAGGFAALRGSLPRPVGGPVTSIFGRPVVGAPTAGVGADLSILRHGFTYRPSAREAVHAVAEGVVRVAGPFEGYGRLVVVEHSDGYFSCYGFLGSTSVAEGQRLRRMATVGRAGLDPLTGRSATYFELRHGERPLDPAVWLRR